MEGDQRTWGQCTFRIESSAPLILAWRASMTSSHFSWRLQFAGITRQWSRKRKKRGRSSLDLSLIVTEIEGMGALEGRNGLFVI